MDDKFKKLILGGLGIILFLILVISMQTCSVKNNIRELKDVMNARHDSLEVLNKNLEMNIYKNGVDVLTEIQKLTYSTNIKGKEDVIQMQNKRILELKNKIKTEKPK